jgi:hypothetical protein
MLQPVTVILQPVTSNESAPTQQKGLAPPLCSNQGCWDQHKKFCVDGLFNTKKIEVLVSDSQAY